MLNYINAEFYKVFHRKYPYITFLCLSACAALLCAGFIFINTGGSHVEFMEAGMQAVMVMGIGMYAAILVGDMVFSDQYKSNTLKNEVSYGIPRARIYLSKLAVEAVIGVVLSVLVIAFYEGMCFLTLYASPAEDVTRTVQIISWCVLAAMPQWLAMLSLTNMLFFLIRNNTVASFITVGIILVPPMVLDIAALFLMRQHPSIAEALAYIKSCLPGSVINAASSAVGVWSYIGRSFALGAGWIAVTTAFGLAGFQKKEIV